MARGAARRVHIASVSDLARLIERLRPNEAIALGALQTGLAELVQVVTKQKLNGAANVIARTGADIIYRKGQPALALLDFDTKGMPRDVTTAMVQHGGYWPALVAVLPALQTVARVMRRSTSCRSVPVGHRNAAARFRRGARLRCGARRHRRRALPQDAACPLLACRIRMDDGRRWRATVGALHRRPHGRRARASGVRGRPQYWIRRCARQGKPATDCDRGRCAGHGRGLPAADHCRDRSARELKAKWAHRLAGESAKVRTAFVAKQAKRLAETHRISMKEAMRTIARQCEGILLPNLVLPFDDPDFAGCTVAEVIADPDRFEGATLADPLEGIDYGRCKAG